MSDAQLDPSEHARAAANARWGNTKVTGAAGVVIERADELDEAQAGEVMQAVSRVLPGWIPARSQRMIIAEDREERRQAREDARERAALAEARHDQAVQSWRADAERRGDVVSVEDMLSGQGVPSVNDVLERARDESAAQDAYAARFRLPDGSRPDEVMHSDILPPAKPAARSQTGLAMFNARRRFTARVEARRSADQLEAADPSYARPVSRRSRTAAVQRPAMCSLQDYDRKGFCGCAACFEFEAVTKRNQTPPAVSYR